jgi:hypothetical protein
MNIRTTVSATHLLDKKKAGEMETACPLRQHKLKSFKIDLSNNISMGICYTKTVNIVQCVHTMYLDSAGR